MARYKSEDNALMMFNRFYQMCETKEQQTLVLNMKQAFLELPTADVVPRDEVMRVLNEIEQEIVAALESNRRVYIEHLEKYGNNPNLEFLCICNAKTNALRGIEDFIEELKKKYTEGE